jgi:hypothetical protein
MYGSPSQLFAESAVGITAEWRRAERRDPLLHFDANGDGHVQEEHGPQLNKVYAELKAMGAIDGVVQLCDLLQCGIHRWFSSARPHAYLDAASDGFWRHVGAILVVGQGHSLNAEFQQAAAAFAAGVRYSWFPDSICGSVVV